MFDKDLFQPKANDKETFLAVFESYKTWIYDFIKNNKGMKFNAYMKESDIQSKAMSDIFLRYNYLSNVKKTDEVSELYEFMVTEYEKYSDPFSQDPVHYEFIKSLVTENETEERLKKRYIEAFEKSGIDLPKDKQDELNAISQELSTAQMLFSKNLIDSKKEWSYTLTPEVKATLSEKDLESFKEIDGELVMKFNQNAMGDIMVKSPSDELKQIIYEASGYPGSPRSNFDNTEVTKKILSLKQQIAAIMGYKSYTEMALEDRMAPTYDVVTNFLGRIKEKMQPLAKVEYEALNQFAKNEFGVDTIPKWNRGFYGNIKKEKLLNYEFNMERPYFNKDRVFEGVFNLVEKLFGFTFVKDTEAFDLPYEDSECFKVYEGDVLKARLIVDMYERELKGSGAWVSCLSGVTLDEVGLVSLCCNINKKDIGMDIDEIVTFLHEMGHAVHHFSSKVQYSDMAGTSGMARDAVEIPSQMLEQFAYDPEFLMSVSGHVETGEKIPQVMLNSIIASKNYNVGSMYARQLVLATFDINLYNTFEGDITDFYKSIANEILPSKVDDDTSFPNTFGHIFAGGYSAGYYGYMWADIYSVDAFMHVIEDKEKNAIKFKKEFLEKGSSVEPLKLYDNFRGQEVSIDNFLSYYGVS